jgi:hypothetical protein
VSETIKENKMLVFSLLAGVAYALKGCQNDDNYNDGISIPRKATAAERSAAIATVAAGVVHNYTAHPGLSPTLGGPLGNNLLLLDLQNFFATASPNAAQARGILDATLAKVGVDYVKTVDEYVTL